MPENVPSLISVKKKLVLHGCYLKSIYQNTSKLNCRLADKKTQKRQKQTNKERKQKKVSTMNKTQEIENASKCYIVERQKIGRKKLA